MKAVFINEHGGTDKLVYGDRPDPEVGPGEVMLRVGASALNHLDLNLREGRTYNGPLPRVMGCDIAGEVAAISPAASTSLKIGDRVILNNRVTCGNCDHCRLGNDQWCPNQKRLGVDLDGGHADFITAPAVNAHVIPDDMEFPEAASLPIAAHTAWHCLVTQAQIRPWDDVLVQAAGSGVGSMGHPDRQDDGRPRNHYWPEASGSWTRLGNGAPTRSSTTARHPTSANESRSSPTARVLTSSSTALAQTSGSRTSFPSSPGGRLVITGVTSGARADLNLSLLQGKPLHLMGSGGRSNRTFADFMKVVRNGALRGIPGRVFPLFDVGSAHQAMQDRDFYGKIVIEN